MGGTGVRRYSQEPVYPRRTSDGLPTYEQSPKRCPLTKGERDLEGALRRWSDEVRAMKAIKIHHRLHLLVVFVLFHIEPRWTLFDPERVSLAPHSTHTSMKSRQLSPLVAKPPQGCWPLLQNPPQGCWALFTFKSLLASHGSRNEKTAQREIVFGRIFHRHPADIPQTSRGHIWWTSTSSSGVKNFGQAHAVLRKKRHVGADIHDQKVWPSIPQGGLDCAKCHRHIFNWLSIGSGCNFIGANPACISIAIIT